MRKEDFYQGVKTVGFVTFIPFMLAAGPLCGYLAGDFIQKKFNLSPHLVLLSVGVGFIAGVIETVKIIKSVIRMNKK